MEVTVINERGFDEALYGLSLSYKDSSIDPNDWWNEEKKRKMIKVADALAHKGGGHSKFLESIVVWLDINAPRYWWSELDTYRVGVTKQSESTMHRLNKRGVTVDDFCQWIPQELLDEINRSIEEKQTLEHIKGLLPESYMQRRLVVTNYKTLQNIVGQRMNHRLPEWAQFCVDVLQGLRKPKWIYEEEKTRV